MLCLVLELARDHVVLVDDGADDLLEDGELHVLLEHVTVGAGEEGIGGGLEDGVVEGEHEAVPVHVELHARLGHEERLVGPLVRVLGEGAQLGRELGP